MSTPTKQKYRTTNWKAYNAALKQRGSLLIWVDQDMCWYEAAIQFCLTIKGLFNLALRQATGMAQSLLKLAGLDWEVPDFSTVSRCQKYLAVEISANATTTGLHLLVDSTGIKMLGEGEWKTKRFCRISECRRAGQVNCGSRIQDESPLGQFSVGANKLDHKAQTCSGNGWTNWST